MNTVAAVDFFPLPPDSYDCPKVAVIPTHCAREARELLGKAGYTGLSFVLLKDLWGYKYKTNDGNGKYEVWRPLWTVFQALLRRYADDGCHVLILNDARAWGVLPRHLNSLIAEWKEHAQRLEQEWADFHDTFPRKGGLQRLSVESVKLHQPLPAPSLPIDSPFYLVPQRLYRVACEAYRTGAR